MNLIGNIRIETLLKTAVADSYIRISSCLTQIATIETTEIDK